MYIFDYCKSEPALIILKMRGEIAIFFKKAKIKYYLIKKMLALKFLKMIIIEKKFTIIIKLK